MERMILPELRAAYDPAPDPERRRRVDAVVAVYETLMQRVASVHAPELLEVVVTMSQAKVLYLVQAEPSMRLSVLATRLGVSLSTISGVVDRLVDQGLVDRRDDRADRRQVVLRITEAGATQLDHFRELNAAQVRALLGRVDDASLAVVERALDILATAAALPRDAAPTPTPANGGVPS